MAILILRGNSLLSFQEKQKSYYNQTIIVALTYVSPSFLQDKY